MAIDEECPLAVAVTLAMVVEEVDVGMSKGTPGLSKDVSNEAGHSGPVIEDLIASAGMGGVNRNLDFTTGWTVFPELYEDDDDGAFCSTTGRGLTSVRWSKAG